MINELTLQRLQDTTTDIKKLLNQHQIPGCSICISHEAEQIWSWHEGLADMDSGTPVTKDTTFRIGSVTKPFTAMVMMKLRDEGLIQLDEPIHTYEPLLSLLKSHVSEPVPLTFRMIASHISGLPKTLDKASHIREITLAECIDLLTIFTPPWSIINYSSLGYSILSKVLEKVSGQPFRELMQSRILDPLHLKQTGFIETTFTAKGYTVSSSGLSDISYPSAETPSWEDGSSGLFSTADDLIQLIQAQYGGSRLLHQHSLKEMQSPVMVEEDFSRGVGLSWFLRPFNGFTLAEHSGEIKGFTSYIGFIPKQKLGICILLNSDERIARPIADRLFQLMLPADNEQIKKREDRLKRMFRQSSL
ncbi:serine hydrolase domain-containing protein [Bacillus zhangzhouensis]|uniref:serine hydrolase domain-containing protein n=1 Tax=Bacillus zhangzhouensis TaxID=1178540 RepID=UPI002E235F55|nr:serine hydrolase [Bacillus zhangzhouensis]